MKLKQRTQQRLKNPSKARRIMCLSFTIRVESFADASDGYSPVSPQSKTLTHRRYIPSRFMAECMKVPKSDIDKYYDDLERHA